MTDELFKKLKTSECFSHLAGGHSSGSSHRFSGIAVCLCNVWHSWGLVTADHEVRTSIYLFFSEQSSNLSFSLLKPAHRGHTANSDVENCVSVLVKLRDGSYCIQHMRQEAYHKNFWKTWFHVCFMNQSIKTGCYINFPWSNMYIYGPEIRRCIPQKFHGWHFYITPGSPGKQKAL